MSNQPKILIADDERNIRLMLETGLTLNGFRVASVRTGREALEAASSGEFDAILSDVYMPDGGGLELVDSLRAADPKIPIVLMTAQGSLQVAVEAVARGATDFIGKPFDISAVVALLRRYLEARREADAETAPEDPPQDFTSSGLVGRSAAMVEVYKLVAQAARADVNVLITGESGTGKELVAHAIHDFSKRKPRPFLSVNCSGLTDTLLESELFGHVRGAFTGADRDRAGLFEAADGGTLFLDELASTSPAFQASLLRVLQSGEVRRVGSTQSRRVNVRVTGASNAPLQQLVAAGSFRADLYYRLSVLSLELPPLRRRAGDVELLSGHFLRLFQPAGEAPVRLTREACEALAAHDFPGNVRELENALRRALALSSGGLITIDCLPPEIAAFRRNKSSAAAKEQQLIADRPNMDELQRRYLQLVLEENHWNRRRAAAVLNLDRRTIQRLIARYQFQGAPDLEDDAETEAGNESAERPLDSQ
ncbi:MAG: sigma-54 dependent transcriptional regulator [Candidatus Sulfopaludibacter sp.]|nr:sigma-54 dependent transcriptional regulator [Candidatus Sulfopaludibacter sp.]